MSKRVPSSATTAGAITVVQRASLIVYFGRKQNEPTQSLPLLYRWTVVPMIKEMDIDFHRE